MVRASADGGIEETGPPAHDLAAIDFIERKTAEGTPWFVWRNGTRMHFRIHAGEVMRERADEIAGRDVDEHFAGMIPRDLHVGLLEIVSTTHSGTSADAFIADARAWLDEATHPDTGMEYDAMIHQPVPELPSELRDERFATGIVSGGGLHFIRAVSEEAHNVPPAGLGTTGKPGRRHPTGR